MLREGYKYILYKSAVKKKLDFSPHTLEFSKTFR